MSDQQHRLSSAVTHHMMIFLYSVRSLTEVLVYE